MGTDLDTILTSALLEANQRLEIDEARRKLRKLKASPWANRHEDEQEALRATINRYEATAHWTSLWEVHLIQRQTCSCGATSAFSQGLFIKQQHRKDSHTQRLVLGHHPGLGRRVEFHDSSVHLCPECSHEWEKGSK